MRRTALLLLLAGCASAGTAAEGSDAVTRPPAIFQSAQTGTVMGDAPRSEATIIAAPPEAVWQAVKKVYAAYDIPITLENPASHQIGNQSFIKSRQLAGKPMASLIDCGSGMTGPKAATYRITAALVTDVIGMPTGGTKVQTLFTAQGQDMTGTSSDNIHCGTNGRLELQVLDAIRAAVAKP